MIQYLAALGEELPQSRLGITPLAIGITCGLMTSFDDVRRIMKGSKGEIFGKSWLKDIIFRPAENSICIFDSGLFSIFDMAMKNKNLDVDRLFQSYAPAYRDYINYVLSVIPAESKRHCFFVNLDTDFLLGLDKTRIFNEMLLRECPRENLICTYHAADGKKYLDELIEKFDYIAIADGMRFNDEGFALRYVQSVCEYIKNKRPEIKIHVLGKSKEPLFKIAADVADTCDSSSWRCFADIEKLNCNNVDMGGFWTAGFNYGFCGGLERIKRMTSGIPQTDMQYTQMMIEVLQLYDILSGANKYSPQVVRRDCPVRDAIDDMFGVPHSWWNTAGGDSVKCIKLKGVKSVVGGRKIMDVEFMTSLPAVKDDSILDIGQNWSDWCNKRKNDWCRRFQRPEDL